MVSVSFISSIYDLNTTIKKIDESNADFIHVDMMDGKFVENKNFTIGEIVKMFSKTKKRLDVHLMCKDPLKYLEQYAMLNIEYFTFHYEALKEVGKAIQTVKDLGIKVGVAINPETSVEEIKPYLNDIDLVLVMSVVPGAGGQEFMDSSLSKIEELSSLKGNYLISVDGGINNETASKVIEAGVDILVSGSYICKNENYNKQIDCLKGNL